MSADKLRVEITADSTGIKGGMDEASSAVSSAVDAMQGKFASIGSTASSAVDAMKASFASIGSAVSPAVSRMQEAVGDLSGSFGGMASGLGSITGLLNPFTSAAKAAMEAVGGLAAVFKVAASEEEKYVTQILNLARGLGITVEEAQTFKQAMDDIAAKYATGEIAAESIVSSFKRFSMQLSRNREMLEGLGLELQNQDGTWKNSFDLYMEAVKHLQGLETQQQKVAFAARILGRGVSEDMIVVLEHLSKDTLEEAHAKLEKLGLIIGPEMVAKVTASKEATLNLHEQWAALSATISTVAIPAWTMMKNVMADIPLVINKIIGGIGDLISRMGTLWTRVTGMPTRMPGMASSAAPNLPPGAMPQHETTGAKPEDLKADRDKKKPDSQMGQFEEQLKARQVVEQAWEGLSGAEELRFWTAKLAIASRANNDYIDVLKKVSEAKIKAGREDNKYEQEMQKKDEDMILLDGEVRKKEAEQQRKVQDETLRAAIKSVDEEYTATASGINNQYKLREITAEKQSALLLAANEKRFASEQELQAKLLALWNSDPVQFQKVLNEMAAAWQKYQKTAQTTNQTVSLEIKKQNEDIAKEIGGPFKSAFEGAFDAMIKGGQTAQQTMLKFVEMVAEGFEKLIAKIILAIAEQLILNAITGGTAAAPGLAGAIGKGLGLFSAAGGYDVPSNINPVTQLHQEEMVLPADLANNVRGMAGGSRGQGGGQGGGHTFNIYALLPKDAASAVKQALRMGHR